MGLIIVFLSSETRTTMVKYRGRVQIPQLNDGTCKTKMIFRGGRG